MDRDSMYDNTVALVILFQGVSAWDELPEVQVLNEHGERELIAPDEGVDTLTHDK